jgi:hypothetical protein
MERREPWTNLSAHQAAAQKKNANINAAAAAAASAPSDMTQEGEAPTPATPLTPSTTSAFKAGQTGGTSAAGTSGPQTTTAPASAPATAPAATQSLTDPTQTNFGMDASNPMVRVQCRGQDRAAPEFSLTQVQVDFSSMDFANPGTSDDVLTDFNFDAFLHDNDDTPAFDFSTSYGGMDATGEIGAE